MSLRYHRRLRETAHQRWETDVEGGTGYNRNPPDPLDVCASPALGLRICWVRPAWLPVVAPIIALLLPSAEPEVVVPIASCSRLASGFCV